jgi:hypothetical protein
MLESKDNQSVPAGTLKTGTEHGQGSLPQSAAMASEPLPPSLLLQHYIFINPFNNFSRQASYRNGSKNGLCVVTSKWFISSLPAETY